MNRVVTIPYCPRKQFKPYHKRTQRFAVFVARRRGGKTVAAANDLIKRALMNTRKFPQPRYAFIGPLFKQTRRNVWEYFKYYAKSVPGTVVNSSNYEITLPTGALIYIDGADNPDALRGGYLDGAVLDEFQDMKPIALDTVIMPMLGDYKGWLTITGTAKGKNQLYQVIYGDDTEGITGAIDDPEEWFCEIVPFSGSDWGDEEEVERIRKKMSVDKFNQEYECSFEVPIQGSIYGKMMEAAKGQICPVPYNPAFPVITAWDIGYADTLAIGFLQLVGKEPRMIDYYENNLEAIDHYVKIVKEKPYNYECHVFPHDAGHKSLRTGTTLAQQVKQMGLGNDKTVTVLPADSIESGIELVRQLLPQMWFDEVKTKLLVKAVTAYQYEYNEERQTYSNKPLHNWASHPSDMMRYMATYLARRKQHVVQSEQPSYSAGYNSQGWMG